jgi:hypothetical protein
VCSDCLARKRVSGFNNPNRIGVIHLSLLQLIGTMTGDGEPARILLPYLQRADELQKHDHLVAYYCKSVAPLCLLFVSVSVSVSVFVSVYLSRASPTTSNWIFLYPITGVRGLIRSRILHSV